MGILIIAVLAYPTVAFLLALSERYPHGAERWALWPAVVALAAWHGVMRGACAALRWYSRIGVRVAMPIKWWQFDRRMKREYGES
jgi:hypothetical protein